MLVLYPKINENHPRLLQLGRPKVWATYTTWLLCANPICINLFFGFRLREFLEHLVSLIATKLRQKQILANYGITMEDVKQVRTRRLNSLADRNMVDLVKKNVRSLTEQH